MFDTAWDSVSDTVQSAGVAQELSDQAKFSLKSLLTEEH